MNAGMMEILVKLRCSRVNVLVFFREEGGVQLLCNRLNCAIGVNNS